MKRTMRAIALFGAVNCLVGMCACAGTSFMEDGVEYTVQADGYGASAEDASLEEVVILSEINGKAVTCAVDFTGCYRLKKAVLPNSVREIYNAFEGCYSLTSVEFGSGLEWIGANAFSGCVSLESVLLPDGVTEIGAGAFFRCDALKNVSLPLSLAEIGDEAFSRCLRLNAVTFCGEKFDSVEDFIQKLIEYLEYYNNERISLKLNGLSPVQYRTQSQA